MSINEIAPCPFCAGQPSSVISTQGLNGDNYWVACINCGCRGPVAKWADKAIEFWNSSPLENAKQEVKND